MTYYFSNYMYIVAYKELSDLSEYGLHRNETSRVVLEALFIGQHLRVRCDDNMCCFCCYIE